MAIAQITAWLSQQNRIYAVGVELYDRYGDKNSLKALFHAADSNYHYTRLVTALTELNDRQLPDSFIVEEFRKMSPEQFRREVLNFPSPSLPERPSIPRLQDISIPDKRYSLTDAEWEGSPDQIRDLYSENSKLNARANMMYNQLHIADSDDRRLELSLQMLDDRDQMRDNWNQVKEYQATGELRARFEVKNAADVESNTANELAAILRNTPTYISKDRKKLENLKPGSQRNKVLARIQDNETKLEAAKRRMQNVEIV